MEFLFPGVMLGLGLWIAIWPGKAQSLCIGWATRWWHLAPTEEWYRRNSRTTLRVYGAVCIVCGAIILAAMLVGRA